MTALLMYPPMSLTFPVLNDKVDEATKELIKLGNDPYSGVKRVIFIQATKLGNKDYVLLTVQFATVFTLVETITEACINILAIAEKYNQ